MPSRKRQPIQLNTTSTMLYDSVDNYHPIGFEDNSVRMNNHEDLNDFSSQSIVCAMDRFVKAVNNMNETIMVPCRLLDIEVGTQKTTTTNPTTTTTTNTRPKVPKLLKAGGDPYTYYAILNSVKNDLIWGATSNDDDGSSDEASLMPSINGTRWTGQESVSSKKQPLRRQSTLSLASEVSNTSEGDSSEGCPTDSIEDDERSTTESDENPGTVAANSVRERLRTHLLGLHSCLKNLTDTATYITDCYQEVVNI